MPSLIRVAIIITSGFSLAVGLYASVTAIGDHGISYLAAEIRRGERIENSTLKNALTRAGFHNQSCSFAVLSDPVIVRLRLLEILSGSFNVVEADRELSILNSENLSSLQCQPTGSFSWLLQFWLNTISGRSDIRDWEFLERSYEAGRLEGWVAARRSRIAIASFDLAPESLQNKTVLEFKALLEYDFIDDGVKLYASASAPVKRRLNEAVQMLDIAQRRSFSRQLAALRPSELHTNTITNADSSGRNGLP